MLSLNSLNPYLKFIVSLIGPLSTALGATYGHTTWYPFIAACVASALVYLSPNTPKTAAPVVPLAPTVPAPGTYGSPATYNPTVTPTGQQVPPTAEGKTP